MEDWEIESRETEALLTEDIRSLHTIYIDQAKTKGPRSVDKEGIRDGYG